MSVLLRDLCTIIHWLAAAGLIAVLASPDLRRRFEARCVGTATAEDLAFVRIVACAILFAYLLTESLPTYARLAPELFAPPGLTEHFGDGWVTWFVTDPGRLRAIGWLLGGLLIAGALGVLTRLVLPLALVTYVVFAALLRSGGKAFHEGYLAGYLLAVVAVLPAGDAWSVDAWLRRRRGRPAPEAAYGWMVWACFAAVALPYLQLAFSKLSTGGLYWFEGHSIRNLMLSDDLNLTEWELDLGLRFHQLPTLFFTIAGLFGVVGELLYPLVLVLPRWRRLLAAAIGLLHLGIWFGQDALFLDAILVPLIFFGPSRWPWRRR